MLLLLNLSGGGGGGGGVFGAGIAACIFTVSTNHCNTIHAK